MTENNKIQNQNQNEKLLTELLEFIHNQNLDLDNTSVRDFIEIIYDKKVLIE
jgi:hypothetical protein